MSAALAPIASTAVIVEGQESGRGVGTITVFFRQWLLSLIARVQQAIFVSSPPTKTINATAAIVTATLHAVKFAGEYRVGYYFQKIVPDGAASTLQVTIGWLYRGVAQTFVGPLLATDTINAYQGGSIELMADANSDITYAIAYSSTTPNKMTYDAAAWVEVIA